MDENLVKELKKIAQAIRSLSMDAVQKANSGHPGLPLGCAEIGAYLYGHVLKHYPKNPRWINRDRFVLSAGHGSMLLYSCLHLAGFDLSLEAIRNFRQLYSGTPGHPEYGETVGVEATTGPLGQGIGNAVGMALGFKILANKFNREEFKIINNKVFCLAGDGCIMEGVAGEAAAFAAHLKLNNLVLIYDYNGVTLDGMLSDISSEDTRERFRAYGWEVYEAEGHDFDSLDRVFSQIENQKAPVLIIAHTVIGKGSPKKQGNSSAHGSPLGADEIRAAKEALGLPLNEEFYVPQTVYDFFNKRLIKQRETEECWNDLFRKWSKANPLLLEEFEKMKIVPKDLEHKLQDLKIANPIAGRNSSQCVLEFLAEEIPSLYGGSADLSSSDRTFLKKYDVISSKNFKGRNIKFGVREFAMGTIINGLALTGMILPFCGTFLVFSDYMKNAIRLAALSSLKVVYQFTHDSIFVGEDGPTHQPVEQLAALRSIPNLHVIRPGDSNEVKRAWIAALQYGGPTAIVLSRQSLPLLSSTDVAYSEGVGKGAYIVKREKAKADFTLFASGSEVFLALEVASSLEHLGKNVRVVSFPSFELFDEQPLEYRRQILGDGKRVSIEAATDFGWHKYIGSEGISICVESFGFSAPAQDIANEFGFTVDAILQRLVGA